ncbi:hypothetical protein N9937_02060 [bacterium]|nr:hypothetical protein [bacterium]
MKCTYCKKELPANARLYDSGSIYCGEHCVIEHIRAQLEAEKVLTLTECDHCKKLLNEISELEAEKAEMTQRFHDEIEERRLNYIESKNVLREENEDLQERLRQLYRWENR